MLEAPSSPCETAQVLGKNDEPNKCLEIIPWRPGQGILDLRTRDASNRDWFGSRFLFSARQSCGENSKVKLDCILVAW